MNQVVVVSGGGTGIGLATATYFARRQAQVVIVGRRADAQRDAKKAEAMNGRAATPADIADTIGWLASPAARHVTAQIVQVNGGAERGR
ncbi:hypothetical protein GQ56_0135125 [Burkholderia paludis]|uniref:SDR family oxidoreductase n=1 Tax=Burkholderia paludis TaxID=1506587 RepID=UPI0004DB5FFB|nr:SDR family oxidoreductase [Burkholderia paludis]KFG92822.1 hypothetical protein GQ56_0135125 [Burkholderia paludis]